MEKVLDVIAFIDNVLTSDIYHCHNLRKRFVYHYISQSIAVPRHTTSVCAIYSVLTMDVIIVFQDKPVFYMLLSEGLLMLGILGQT